MQKPIMVNKQDDGFSLLLNRARSSWAIKAQIWIALIMGFMALLIIMNIASAYAHLD
jgi:hypothetical protein